MKTIPFNELHKIAFDIHHIIILNQHWENGQSFTISPNGRPDNGIMMMVDCAFEYIDAEKRVYDRALPGQIVYSPRGSQYTCRFLPRSNIQQNEYVADYLINFILIDEIGEELRLSDDRMVITPENTRYYLDTFRRIDSLGRKGLYPSARVKGMLYNLLCDISLELQEHDIMTRNYAAIYPAIEYIRETDLAELDTATLAERCHISDSCFRRLFREYTGMPPLEYVNHLKVTQARARLQSGVMTVAEVAESLGFTDPSYFSRFYKKATGRSPSEE
ncbi:MAG: helix-turn-helix transcriptional regulator [Clostridia bacterium]|nr:helix-turn-helix transcriptional regulator [Clostridia bacterium]